MKTPEEIKKIAEDYAHNELSIYPDKSKNLSEDEIHRIKTVVFSHSYIGFKNGYTQCQQDNTHKKYTDEDLITAIEKTYRYVDGDGWSMDYIKNEIIKLLNKKNENT